MQAGKFQGIIKRLKCALEGGSSRDVLSSSQDLMDGLCYVFRLKRIRMKVLDKRPSKSWGELHGLYERISGKEPQVTVWMRTAKKKDLVSFKTFLRTIVHEFMRHLDYGRLGLKDSLHTAGFFKRESHVMRQLLLHCTTSQDRTS